jgi:starvation-inducible DNA-binding protein
MTDATMNDEHVNGTPFPTRVRLADDTRAMLVKGLNVSLASTFDLHSQVKQAHWNLKGAQFVARHELFDDLADHLRGWTDDLAERATTLGGYAEGTTRRSAERSVIPEYDLRAVDGRQHLQALAERYGAYCGHIRELVDATQQLGDPATEDLYTEILRDAEMDLWFLEAHLQS